MLRTPTTAAALLLTAVASAESSGRVCGNEGGASSTVCSLPPWPATWQMNASTIIMPCNYTGYQVPSTIAGWGVVDFECAAFCAPMNQPVLRLSSLLLDCWGSP